MKKYISKEEKHKPRKDLIFLKEKCKGRIKARKYEDGRKQWENTRKEKLPHQPLQCIIYY